MKDVYNANGALIAKVDEGTKSVEIVRRGSKTIIVFNPDGSIQVINFKAND